MIAGHRKVIAGLGVALITGELVFRDQIAGVPGFAEEIVALGANHLSIRGAAGGSISAEADGKMVKMAIRGVHYAGGTPERGEQLTTRIDTFTRG